MGKKTIKLKNKSVPTLNKPKPTTTDNNLTSPIDGDNSILKESFLKLPVKIANSNEPSQFSIHPLFFKKYNSGCSSNFYTEDELPLHRTLILKNLPLDISNADLIELFTDPFILPNLSSHEQPERYKAIEKVILQNSNFIFKQKEGHDESTGAPIVFSKDEKTDSAKKMRKLFQAYKVQQFTTIVTRKAELKNIEANNLNLLSRPNSAYIIFKDAANLDYILSELSCNQLDLLPAITLKKSLFDCNQAADRWGQQYSLSRPNHSTLQTFLDEYVAEYTFMMESSKYKSSLAHDIADEDGFVTVTAARQGNTIVDPNYKDKSIIVHSISLKDAKRIKTDMLENGFGKLAGPEGFYRFQSRQNKKSRLDSLRTQFEKDKKRIQELKKANHFK